MIEINLLPPELRKKKIKLPRQTLINTAVITLFCLVILHIILAFIAARQKKQLKLFQQEWKILQPQKIEADTVINQMQLLRNKETLIRKASGLDIVWAQKLNLISDLIPAEIWLTKVSLESRTRSPKPSQQRKLNLKAIQELKKRDQKILVISGVVAAGRSSEMLSPVSRFITRLKREPLFFNDFEEVELGQVKRKKIDNKEVMVFELICILKEEQEQGLESSRD